MYYTKFKTTLCDMVIVGDEAGITRLHLVSQEGNRTIEIHNEWIENKAFFEEAIKQIKDYLLGERRSFQLKLNPEGTLYQRQVWEALREIGYGETKSYKEIAIRTGNPKASRAIGSANGKNPIPIIIPCHRVIGASGKLTGYAFGLTLKENLLYLENDSQLENE